MVRFITAHRATYGVEPICTCCRSPRRRSSASARNNRTPRSVRLRALRDDELRALIQRVHHENFGVYGPRKVWRQLRREGHRVARCTVERLMRAMGLAGAVRGRAWTVTTQSQPALIVRPIWSIAPSWRSGQTSSGCRTSYVATWAGFVCVAFAIDVFARRIVGWRVSSSMRTDFVLDALDQAISARGGTTPAGLVHHSDQGTQYLSMRYTDRLADAGIAPSVGSRGDAYDNALAESVIGLFKTEVIQRFGPWRHLDNVEWATLTWVDWFNTRRLLEPIGYVPPAEYEAQYYEQAQVA